MSHIAYVACMYPHIIRGIVLLHISIRHTMYWVLMKMDNAVYTPDKPATYLTNQTQTLSCTNCNTDAADVALMWGCTSQDTHFIFYLHCLSVRIFIFCQSWYLPDFSLWALVFIIVRELCKFFANKFVTKRFLH